MVVLEEVIFNISYFVWMWWSWKELILIILYFVFSRPPHILCGCGGLERTDFKQFLIFVDMVVLKEVIFNIFYFV